jgi:GH35 family endo-1,4-beta-xylanase
MNRRTVDQVRDPFFIHELVFVRLAVAGEATANFAVSFWFWGLTESESWRNHRIANPNNFPLMIHLSRRMLQQRIEERNWQN